MLFIFVLGAEVWRALVPMILFHIVEYHQPDRVMHQFGLDQPIHRRSHQPDHLHSVTLSGEHDRTLLQQISQPVPPSKTWVRPPPEEVEQGGSRAHRQRTGLAANRTRLRDDEQSSSSSHGTQSSTPAPTGPPSQPPQQHFPQHPFPYPGYIVYPIPPPHTEAAESPMCPAFATLEALLRFADEFHVSIKEAPAVFTPPRG
ncbi:hypothetical protein PIB30_017384 [Stylosanthes scabra]|uniref:Uncharacterized protein n=1 Tax=Stylosanthes scabra TaxID=79078 RepID=A0ABU6V981_9FABA|nr:hypothetical protein [Stylosanthes scabra]